MYEYKAVVIKVYDGDTVTVDVDLGWSVVIKKQKIRLLGINAPEVRGKSKQAGKESRDRLKEKILDQEITLKTFKDKKGKYGRWLGIIILDDMNINDWMVENNLAVKY
jgi:micrococcal nuclease